MLSYTSLPPLSQFAADGNTSLVLTLHHPDAHVRVGALHRLQSLLAPSSPGGAVTIAERDRDFISSAIQARLRDDDPLVVKAALDLGPEVRTTCLPVNHNLGNTVHDKNSFRFGFIQCYTFLLCIRQVCENASN